MAGDGQPVRLALLGAGLFSRQCYLPTLKGLPGHFQVVALWSLSEVSVTKLLSEFDSTWPDAKGYHGGGGLDELLACDGVDAVALVLPCHVQLEIAKKALLAGKHVLQEKPIAGRAADARAALKWYGTAFHSQPQPLWSIAENYRFEDAFLCARDRLADIGELLKVDLIVDATMNAGNMYYGSTWRRDPEACPGGFLMEGPVHFMAALRLVTQAKVLEAQGITSSHPASGLPPPDTVVGTMRLSNGCPVNVSLSFAAGTRRFSLSVVGIDGSVEVLREGAGYCVRCCTTGMDTAESSWHSFVGVEAEMTHFAECVQRFKAGDHPVDIGRGAATEGFHDLAAIEALLESGSCGSVTKTVMKI